MWRRTRAEKSEVPEIRWMTTTAGRRADEECESVILQKRELKRGQTGRGLSGGGEEMGGGCYGGQRTKDDDISTHVPRTP